MFQVARRIQSLLSAANRAASLGKTGGLVGLDPFPCDIPEVEPAHEAEEMRRRCCVHAPPHGGGRGILPRTAGKLWSSIANLPTMNSEEVTLPGRLKTGGTKNLAIYFSKG